MTAALLAEWTKLRTVRRWVLTLALAAGLIAGFGPLAASSGGTDANEHPNFVVGPQGEPVTDEFEFVHRPLPGDGSLTVRVATQAGGAPGAMAGIVVKAGLGAGSAYVSLYATPRDGVRLSHDYRPAARGSSRTAPVWLRLTRAGDTITGEESADGRSWARVGAVRAPGLTGPVQAGPFVAAPPIMDVQRRPGGTSVQERPSTSTATFDNVSATGQSGDWAADAVTMPREKDERPATGDRRPPEGEGEGEGRRGSFEQRDGVLTVTGQGEVGPKAPDDDPVSIALFGVIAGFMALVAVGVLFVTAEYRRGMIRTTFAADPARGRTLAAKALVLGAVSFLVALAGGAAALLLARAPLQRQGFAPPAFPRYGLGDWPVLRALLLTSAFLALLAVFAMALGAIVRHSATAIAVAIALVVLPVIAGSVAPLGVGRWVMRLTPAGGLATWRARPPTDLLSDPTATIQPLAGLAGTAAYTGCALLLAWWLLRRRDV
ncbi:ABC transporter permease subunit [Dactylosporangium sp. CA-233914]|uniref:ABC transporter permease subunit n=1 Tax=Dactylosporangium sp. CA-233914 TaxID=3239934 RepID=UPI003D8A4B05